jgi:hypothetical protein
VIFWIGLVGALALTCAVAALRLIGHRQLGQFEVLASEPGRFRFRSDFGIVEFDPAADRVLLVGEASSGSWPLRDDARVDIRREESRLGLLTELAQGFDWTDLLPAYRDRVVWHVVVLALDNGTVVPVYAIGEHERREFGWTDVLRDQVKLLRRLGWLPDVPKLAEQVRATLLAQLPRAAAAAQPPSADDLAWFWAPRDR